MAATVKMRLMPINTKQVPIFLMHSVAPFATTYPIKKKYVNGSRQWWEIAAIDTRLPAPLTVDGGINRRVAPNQMLASLMRHQRHCCARQLRKVVIGWELPLWKGTGESRSAFLTFLQLSCHTQSVSISDADVQNAPYPCSAGNLLGAPTDKEYPPHKRLSPALTRSIRSLTDSVWGLFCTF